MALHIVHIAEEGIAPVGVRRLLAQARTSGHEAVLWVPSFEAQLTAERALAAAHDPALFGLPVTTPLSWLRERWEVWGDGTCLIEPAQRLLEAELVLSRQGEASGLSFNGGTLEVLAGLAERALPWIPEGTDEESEASAGLTPAERRLLGLLESYRDAIRRQGFTEPCEAAGSIVSRLAEARVPMPAVVVSGCTALGRWQRELLLDLASASDAWYLVPEGNEAASAAACELASLLADGARARRTATDEERMEAASAPGRASELALVRDRIFLGADPIVAEGAVGLLRPAGPLAEAELVAERAAALAREGMGRICVSVPSCERAWRELAPKLHALGLGVRTKLSRPLAALEPGRAFIEYAETVATLDGLRASWPEPASLEDGTPCVRLGDLSWWPPLALSDFLLSDIAHMSISSAQRLDRAWRQDRLLTPGKVLLELQNEKCVSRPVARATAELLKGRIGTAASKLLAPYLAEGEGAPDDSISDDSGAVVWRVARPSDSLADAEAEGVLAGILSLAGTLKELGITADVQTPGHIALGEAIALIKQAMQSTRLSLVPESVPEDAPAVVSILSHGDAAALAPLSEDALICCGQTSVEAQIPTGDDVLGALLERLGVEPEPDPLAACRAQFMGEISVPSRCLVLERTQKDQDAKDSYPSVMLTELLAAYGLADEDGEDLAACEKAGIPVFRRDELEVAADLAATGSAPRLEAAEPALPTGTISDAGKAWIVVPPQGHRVLDGGKPVLSATQIETYLECPYKWFSLRRLGLEDSDAQFSGVEMGVFAHRVLEVVHGRLLADAAARLEGGAPDPALEPWVRIPGSRVSADDPERLAFAHGLLSDFFDEHLARQYVPQRPKRGEMPLIAHTAQDEGQLKILKRDLLSVLDYESGLFFGYEPRYFEWSFGRRDAIEYAGAYITGTIDRIDVDAHRQAVVIDYKHKSPRGFAKEYAAFPGERAAGEELVLPRRVQSLIYGQIVRRAHPELKVTAAVYLSSRDFHALSGAVSENAYDLVFGDHPLSSRMAPAVKVADHESFGTDEEGMDALLDRCEELIAEKIQELMAGNIEASPLDAASCSFCPVLNCEKRLG